VSATQEAKMELARECCRGLREGEGCLPEVDSAINDASRRVITAMCEEHGEAWLGFINRHDANEQGFWKWDESLVYNFGADFVVPRYDAELAQLVEDRNTPVLGGYCMEHNRRTLDLILARLKELGGIQLLWT
jgi:hypothetical protein